MIEIFCDCSWFISVKRFLCLILVSVEVGLFRIRILMLFVVSVCRIVIVLCLIVDMLLILWDRLSGMEKWVSRVLVCFFMVCLLMCLKSL